MAWMDIRAPRCPRIARALLVVPAACWGGYVQQLMFTPTNAEHASHQGYQCRLSKKQPYRRQFQERALKIKAAVRRIVSRSAQRDEITASFPPNAPQDNIPSSRCTACCTCTPEVSADPCSECECDCGIPADGESQPLLTDVEPPQVTRSVRKVSFHPFVKVILVPCIAEYREAGMFDNLW
jgi:hypothetical protein